MLRDEQIAAFDRDGFLNSGPILDNAEIEDIASGLARVLDVGPDGFVEG